MAPLSRVRRHHLAITRDSVMFAIGAALIANESIQGTDRPNILYTGLALMGVSAYLAGTRVVNGK